MVFRVYAEKKPEFAVEAGALLTVIRDFLQIKSIDKVRVINRYDVENTDFELFNECVNTVFSEPRVDDCFFEPEEDPGCAVFACEALPGQFDPRADSAAQCIQTVSRGDRPEVRAAKICMLYGDLSDAEIERIKNYVINPVECREAKQEKVSSLKLEYESPSDVKTLTGFTALDEEGLDRFRGERGLAMDLEDLKFCRDFFLSEGRDPTATEITVTDTYWSDHCRHTTFLTAVDSVKIEDPLLSRAYDEYTDLRRKLGVTRPVCLMDMATIAARGMRAEGKLKTLDESEEVNACTVKINVTVDGAEQPWLLMFKNETHNHPTEIEPFGGAATCIGGAIRDPLSGRSYVYSAMRVTGAADPLTPVSKTLRGKLPQRKLVTEAAAGSSSYGNQIGIATGLVSEIYHPKYVAKRMEIGACFGAVPEANVRREKPKPGDLVILLGGRTGRDGIGGAVGSSKSHNLSSITLCGAEVQKGNAPEERKLQRFFRNPDVSSLVLRCNDFGAGGVAVAVGELADGVDINLNAVPKKYEGLDGTELAVSESQERLAAVVSNKDAERFIKLAEEENIEATVIAKVTEKKRLVMRWRGKVTADIPREFLDSNGAEKHTDVSPAKPVFEEKDLPEGGFGEALLSIASDLNCCSGRGLSERFDSTIGSGAVLMPFGGKYQLTPVQAAVHKIPVLHGSCDTCSVASWGFNPYISDKSPYHGAYLAVTESVCKLIAAGASGDEIWLSFQEYFEKLRKDPVRWGKPFAALLGAFKAQTDLGFAAVGGKDSMSGSFEEYDVPPALVSFAVTVERAENIISPEFKSAANRVFLLAPEYDADGLPVAGSLLSNIKKVTELIRSGKIISAWTPVGGGAAEGIMKMCFGNGVGFIFDGAVSDKTLFGYSYGSFILEMRGTESCGVLLGVTSDLPEIRRGAEAVSLEKLSEAYEDKLEAVFPSNVSPDKKPPPSFTYEADSRPRPGLRFAKPRVLIPVFPGTNCEYDTARAVERAGALPECVVIRNLTPGAMAESVEYFAERITQSQMIIIPGGFSAGDEPDGSGKFITAFFRNGAVRDAVNEFLTGRDGLMCGICNGFQALIKLGLVPYGCITEQNDRSPTLTYNFIGRHQSRIARVRIASNKSPWLALTSPGEIFLTPVSHGEGRFTADDAMIVELSENGRIATQYVDFDGRPTYDVRFNPNGSDHAIEGITSPDGRVFGKMGHAERTGDGLYKNVPGTYETGMFESAVFYFK